MTLYPFQRAAVEYLVEHGGGFLWSDPGLGKTRMSIVAAKRLGGPTLVVCPNSLKLWWQEEISNLSPGDTIVVAGKAGRLPQGVKTPDWCIVHYTGVRMNERLRDIEWGTVILDECHLIKNRKAQRTKAVMKVTPPYAYRIGLTATPFGNDPSDIWAQLRWMAPKLPGLRSYWKFHATFCERESGYNIVTGARYKKVAGGRNLKQLATLMKGFGLRHSKREVASQLPPITDTRIPLEMNGKQAVLYDQLRKKSCYELVVPADDGGPEVRINVANALSRLIRMEQLLSHPWKFLDGVNGAKLEWLLDWAAGYSEQAVIAVRFKETASHVARSLGEACGQPITGDVSTEERHLIIEDWKNNSHQFMVGTIGTIGIGLSFENARAMVLYDQLWSTIKMEQARQRIHRVTSKFPVQILYPCIVDTSNEIILEAFTSHWEQMEVVRAFIQHLQQQEEGQ